MPALGLVLHRFRLVSRPSNVNVLFHLNANKQWKPVKQSVRSKNNGFNQLLFRSLGRHIMAYGKGGAIMSSSKAFKMSRECPNTTPDEFTIVTPSTTVLTIKLRYDSRHKNLKTMLLFKCYNLSLQTPPRK